MLREKKCYTRYRGRRRSDRTIRKGRGEERKKARQRGESKTGETDSWRGQVVLETTEEDQRDVSRGLAEWWVP